MTTTINGSSPSITFSDGSSQTSATRPFLNRLINGGMTIDQRNAGASVTITNTSALTYTLDRWGAYGSAASKFSVQQDAGAVTPPAGFNDYLGVTSLSAYSVGSSDLFKVQQSIEGFNADLGWGTANAKTITLSFWVRSSLTGTFGGALQNNASNRNYPFTYTINAANTWEYKTITIAGDTSGTWLTNSSAGVQVVWGLGMGSSFSGTAGAWAAGNIQSATGATSVVGTNGATFYITGVQLEVGSTATSFDYRPYGTELALCQRYFAKLQNDGSGGDIALGIGMQQSTTATGSYINFPVTMRSEPTAVITNMVVSDFLAFSAAATLSSVSMGYNSGTLNITYSANGATYRPIYLSISNNTTGNIALSAEL